MCQKQKKQTIFEPVDMGYDRSKSISHTNAYHLKSFSISASNNCKI